MMRARTEDRGDGGYMLVELLVVITLMGIVGGLVSDAIITSFRGQRDITARATDLDSLRQAMERTTRDMRAASSVLCAQTNLLTLQTPTPSGATTTTTWSVVTTPAGSSVTEAAGDPNNACVTPAGPGATVLGNLDPVASPFTYLPKAGYQTTSAGSVNQYDCHLIAKPTTFENRCVGGVTVNLAALLPGHPDITLTDVVQLRNIT